MDNRSHPNELIIGNIKRTYHNSSAVTGRVSHVLSKLAEGLNIALETKVTKVDYEEEIVKIVSE